MLSNPYHKEMWLRFDIFDLEVPSVRLCFTIDKLYYKSLLIIDLYIINNIYIILNIINFKRKTQLKQYDI